MLHIDIRYLHLISMLLLKLPMSASLYMYNASNDEPHFIKNISSHTYICNKKNPDETYRSWSIGKGKFCNVKEFSTSFSLRVFAYLEVCIFSSLLFLSVSLWVFCIKVLSWTTFRGSLYLCTRNFHLRPISWILSQIVSHQISCWSLHNFSTFSLVL